MRLWSIHPKYLDAAGLVALWREALLARKVLEGETKGYKHHPQLERFKMAKDPVKAIDAYLSFVYQESCDRRYCFDKTKIRMEKYPQMKVTSGQLAFEFEHLKRKLKERDRERFLELQRVRHIQPHPLFRIVPGPVEKWEKL